LFFNNNIFFSPFSITTALAMTYLGAKEETAEQMVKVLGVVDLKDEVHQSFEKYLNIILKENENFTLHTANRLFPNTITLQCHYSVGCCQPC
jgi:serpin B